MRYGRAICTVAWKTYDEHPRVNFGGYQPESRYIGVATEEGPALHSHVLQQSASLHCAFAERA